MSCGVGRRCSSDLVLLWLWASSYSSDSTPSLGISICCKCGPKTKTKRMLEKIQITVNTPQTALESQPKGKIPIARHLECLAHSHSHAWVNQYFVLSTFECKGFPINPPPCCASFLALDKLYVSFQQGLPCLQRSIVETLLITRHCSSDCHLEITISQSANKKENQIFQR